MKQSGVSTILVHHSKKDGTAPRGTSAMTTTFEVTIGLQEPKNRVMGKASFVLSFGKFRAKCDESLASTTWTLEDTGWKIESDQETTLGRVLEALKSLDYINQSEVAKGLKLAQGTVSKTFARLKSEERLTQEQINKFFAEAKALREVDADDDAETETPQEPEAFEEEQEDKE